MKNIHDIKNVVSEFGLVEVVSNIPKIHTSLVFLLDKDDFINDIKQIRQKIGITNFFISEEDANQFLFEDMFEDEAFDLDLPEHLSDGKIEKQCKAAIDLCKPLAAKYHRTSNYDLPILYATLCNKVDGSSLNVKPNFRYLSADYQHTGVPEMVMVFYPETSIQDVRKVFDKMKKTMSRAYFEEVWNAKASKYDTISRIDRDREIYWYKKMGYSWQNIIDKIDEDYGQYLDIKSVTQSNNQYEKGLNNH